MMLGRVLNGNGAAAAVFSSLITGSTITQLLNEECLLLWLLSVLEHSSAVGVVVVSGQLAVHAVQVLMIIHIHWIKAAAAAAAAQ